MKLLVIILFFAVPLILIIESFFQKLQNRSGSPNQNGIYQTIAALLILTAALFEKPIMDWLLTLFGGMLLPYLGIWTGYLAILLLIQDILSIEFLQKKSEALTHSDYDTCYRNGCVLLCKSNIFRKNL